ncbi:MAG TPA: type II toxin-antitoxin system prevent-host-death family antitoxin [Caulobacteraceae bacterium]|nr:type II toxin-antitoxin system prevent-host-death family antitoxin [Caulobacteraceae bacterium]
MTVQMNIAEAKAKLSELVSRAEAGELVTIARDGKPAVTLSPASPRDDQPRPLGLWDHLGIDIPEGLFLDPDPDIESWLRGWAEEPIAPPE